MTVEAPETFEDGLVDLQGCLPEWWRTRDEDATLYKLLWAWGQQINALAWVWEDTYRDQALQTASREGLVANFAFAWGLTSEEDALGEAGLRAYIEARCQENGTLASLQATLLSLLIADPANQQGGTVLQFPTGGDGLQFPASGEGLQLFQFAAGEGPQSGLQFPADGSGLQFPGGAIAVEYEGVSTAATEDAVPGAPQLGLRLSENQYVEIVQNGPSVNHLEVVTLNWLAFSRPAFKRAIERFAPASCYPPVIRETVAL